MFDLSVDIEKVSWSRSSCGKVRADDFRYSKVSVLRGKVTFRPSDIGSSATLVHGHHKNCSSWPSSNPFTNSALATGAVTLRETMLSVSAVL